MEGKAVMLGLAVAKSWDKLPLPKNKLYWNFIQVFKDNGGNFN